MQKIITFLLKKTNQGWTVTAKVKDTDTMIPIEGATVEIADFDSMLTDRDGVCVFSSVPSSTYRISAGKEGYTSRAEVLILEEEAPIANLWGHVTDASAVGNPINGVKVAVDEKETHTNSEGYYRIEELSVGSHQVVFSKGGYETLVK